MKPRCGKLAIDSSLVQKPLRSPGAKNTGPRAALLPPMSPPRMRAAIHQDTELLSP
jgi:hypothetical protein